ncbi:hypothetical protein BGX31_002523 [Mortierella sp. GBA43]|nr:hypothetical protein BGX31_002523 [Mortierella sp. GBA43]
MTQEDQVLLDHSESGQEYYDDDGEEEDYDEQQEEYQEEEDDGEGITIGEEIQLSHQEVWDDSALIEAWDASVKFYETHHSNPKATGKTTTYGIVSLTNQMSLLQYALT